MFFVVVVVVVFQLRRRTASTRPCCFCREGEAAPLLSLHHLRCLSLEGKPAAGAGGRSESGLRRVMMMMTHRNSGGVMEGGSGWGGARVNLRLAVSISPPRSLSWLCQSSRRLRETALIKTFVRSQSHWAGLIKPLFQMLPAAVNAPRGRRAEEGGTLGIEVGGGEGDLSWGCQTQFKKLFH